MKDSINAAHCSATYLTKVLKKLRVLCQCYIKKKCPHKHQILHFKMRTILFKEVIMVELGEKWEISWRQWRWLKGMGRDTFTQIKWHCTKYIREPLGLPRVASQLFEPDECEPFFFEGFFYFWKYLRARMNQVWSVRQLTKFHSTLSLNERGRRRKSVP